MTEIPKEAVAKARTIAGMGHDYPVPENIYRNFARYIADVSEKAKLVLRVLSDPNPGHIEEGEAFDALKTLILPNPEDDLLKEAREICARVASQTSGLATKYRKGDLDNDWAMRCTLAALRKGN